MPPRRRGYRNKGVAVMSRHVSGMEMIPRNDAQLQSVVKLVRKTEDEAEFKVLSSDGYTWYDVALNLDVENSESECIPDYLFCEDICQSCHVCHHFASCTCPDHSEHDMMCKHIHLVYIVYHKLAAGHVDVDSSEEQEDDVEDGQEDGGEEDDDDEKPNLKRSQPDTAEGLNDENLLIVRIKKTVSQIVSKVEEPEFKSLPLKDAEGVLANLQSAIDLLTPCTCSGRSANILKTEPIR